MDIFTRWGDEYPVIRLGAKYRELLSSDKPLMMKITYNPQPENEKNEKTKKKTTVHNKKEDTRVHFYDGIDKEMLPG